MNQLVEYIKSIFPGADENTIATIVVTLGIFILGYFVKGTVEFISSEINKSRLRDDFKTILKDISNSVYEQHLNFEEFCNSISINRIGHHLASSPIHHLSTIQEYSYREIRSAYISIIWFWKIRSNRKAVNILYKRLSGLEKLEKSYPQDLKEFFDRINKHEASWNENVEAQRDLFDRAFRETEGWIIADLDEEQTNYTNYLREVDRIRNEWIAQGEDTRLHFTIVKEFLIEPLLELGRNTDLNHDIIPKSFNYLLGASYAFQNIQVTFNEMEKSFKSYNDQYAKISRLIKRSTLIN